MSSVLNIVSLVAGLFAAFIGSWGVVETLAAPAATPDGEGLLWLAIAALSAGIGIVAGAADRLLQRARRDTPR